MPVFANGTWYRVDNQQLFMNELMMECAFCSYLHLLQEPETVPRLQEGVEKCNMGEVDNPGP